MSFYRSVFAAIAAMALVAPVFADDTTSTSVMPDNTVTTTETTTTVTEETKLDLNKATRKELIKIKGISPAKAKAIVNYRKKNGDFKTLDELTKVSGFKNLNHKTLKNIQDQLTVE